MRNRLLYRATNALEIALRGANIGKQIIKTLIDRETVCDS